MRTPRLAMAASYLRVATLPATTLGVATFAAATLTAVALTTLLATPLPLVAAPPTPPAAARASAPSVPKITVTVIYDYPFAKYGLPAGTSTIGRGISNAGEVVGSLQIGGGQQGFIRNADGTFSPPLIHPADTTGASTYASGANLTGTIAGGYLGTNGFVLDNGKYTNSANEQFYAINDLGETCGSGSPSNANVGIPGLIASAGQKTTFFAPGATGKTAITTPEAINNLADVAGTFTIDGKIYSSFYRSATGTITEVAIPKATQTLVHGLNDHGWLCGLYLDAQNVEHAFVLIEGNPVSYDYPAGIGTSFNGINNLGFISGRYTTADGIWHGLILKVDR